MTNKEKIIKLIKEEIKERKAIAKEQTNYDYINYDRGYIGACIALWNKIKELQED
jgi:hypothetical protein